MLKERMIREISGLEPVNLAIKKGIARRFVNVPNMTDLSVKHYQCSACGTDRMTDSSKNRSSDTDKLSKLSVVQEHCW